MAQAASNFLPTDYTAEQHSIERQRRYADLLREQSMQPDNINQTAGGWVLPYSPFAGAAKALNAYAARTKEKGADEREKALAQKQQDDYRNMVSTGLRQLQGSPAMPGSPAPADDLGGGPAAPARPAQAPDPMGALATFGSHPQGAALAPLAMQQIQRQQLIQALKGSQAPAQGGTPPAQYNGQTGGFSVPQGSQGQGAQPSGVGGPAGGVPMEAWIQADPTGAKYMEQLAKDNAVINLREGGTAYSPTRGALYTAPKSGIQTNMTPQGPVAVPVQGYGAAQAQITAPVAAAQSGGSAYGAAPYKLDTYNTPGAPSVLTNQQAIEGATGNPMPLPYGMQPVPAARPQSPSQSNFPRETPTERTAAMGGRLRILETELATEQAKLADPRTNPEDRANATSNVAAITKEIAVTKKQNPGLPLQDQGESAEQRKFGEERAKLQVTAPEARAAVADASTNLQRMEGLAREIMSHPALGKVTGVTGAFPNVPGSNAADLDARLGSLKSQVGFAVLQAMRDASKTGGALGAISDRENELLQRNLAALDKTQSSEGMKRSLQQLIDYAAGARQRLSRGYSDQYERVVGNQGMRPTQAGAVPANLVKDIVNSGQNNDPLGLRR